MKILLVNKFLYPNGGSETYMLKLGAYLQEIGNEVQYFGMYDERNVVGNEVKAYAANVNFHDASGNIFNKFKTALSTIYSKDACKAIDKVLRNFNPDIVHMNNINFQLTPAIIYTIKKYNIPIVQTVHDTQMCCPCHRFYIEHKQQICTQCQEGAYWKCIKNKCLQGSTFKSILAAIESYYYHFRGTYNKVDLYISPSRFIADKVMQAGISENKISVMYNFSDKIEQVENVVYKSKYALYFGRFSKEKGISTLLRACEKMQDVKFVLAGAGPMENEVQKKSQELNNVECVGFKSGRELQELIAGAEFSIHPSECYQNCPLSVIESEALGTPVICSDLGGTKELVKDGKTGMVFEGCNEESLIEKIDILWNDSKLVEQMSEECISAQDNTIEKYTEELIRQYNMLIK